MAKIAYPGIADAKEPSAADEGLYELRITAVEPEKKSKSGNVGTQVSLEILHNTENIYNDVMHWVSHPVTLEKYLENPANAGKTEKDWLKSENFKALGTQRFCQKFGLSFDEEGFDTDEWLGATGTVFLSVGEMDDGRKQNSIALYK